jgi:hypothetical protein
MIRTTSFFGSCNNLLTAIATAPGQDKSHAEAYQPTYSSPGRSRRPAVGPPVPGYRLRQIAAIRAPSYPVAAFCYVKVVLFGSTPDERVLGVEDGPHSRWTMKTTTTPPRRRLPKSAAKTMSSSEHGGVRPGTKDCRSRSRSESSESPTRYKQCWNLLLHRPAARDECSLEKLRPPPSATAVSRRRTKTMP